jgi:hypothetical protein
VLQIYEMPYIEQIPRSSPSSSQGLTFDTILAGEYWPSFAIETSNAAWLVPPYASSLTLLAPKPKLRSERCGPRQRQSQHYFASDFDRRSRSTGRAAHRHANYAGHTAIARSRSRCSSESHAPARPRRWTRAACDSRGCLAILSSP